MKWTMIAIIAIVIFIIISILLKCYLRRKLNDIDGLGGVNKANLTNHGGTVIGAFGNDH